MIIRLWSSSARQVWVRPIWPQLLGLVAVQHRFSTYYVNCHQLIEQLKKAHFENRLPDKLRVLAKYRMLIIDEIGYLPMDIKGESYRRKERKEFMRQKQQIVNTLFQQGSI